MSKRQYNLVITDPAKDDIAGIKSYTKENYGNEGVKAYTALVNQALRDVRDDPFRPGSRARPEINDDTRSYHISLSKDRAESSVKSPRHFIIYHLHQNDDLLIKGVLHEARDIPRQIETRELENRFEVKRGRPKKGRRR